MATHRETFSVARPSLRRREEEAHAQEKLTNQLKAAELKALIAFKTVEIVLWDEHRLVGAAWICEHLFDLYQLYTEFEELTEHILTEVLEQIPVWHDLINFLLHKRVIRPALGGSDCDFEPYFGEAVGVLRPHANLTLRELVFGPRTEVLQRASEVADAVQDMVIDELFRTAVTVTEHSFMHDALTCTEHQETDKMLDDAVAHLAADPSVIQAILDEIAAMRSLEDGPPVGVVPELRTVRSFRRHKGHETYTATTFFLNWTPSTSACTFLYNDPEDWTHSDVKHCETFMKEGFRVKLHEIPSEPALQYFSPDNASHAHTPPRVLRYDRIARLSDDGQTFGLYNMDKGHAQGARLLHDPAHRLNLLDVEVVCWGACTKTLHWSLESMNGSLVCLDSTEHAHRCVSLISPRIVLDLEVRPSSMRSRQERVAARQLAKAVACSLQRMVHYERSEKGRTVNLMRHKDVLASMPALVPAGHIHAPGDVSSGNGTPHQPHDDLKSYFSWQSLAIDDR